MNQTTYDEMDCDYFRTTDDWMEKKREELDEETYKAFKTALPELVHSELVVIIKQVAEGVIEEEEAHLDMWDRLNLTLAHAASWINHTFTLEIELKCERLDSYDD